MYRLPFKGECSASAPTTSRSTSCGRDATRSCLWKSELHALLRLSPVCMPTFDQWGIDQQEEEDLCWKEDDQCWSSPKLQKKKYLRDMFITAESKEPQWSKKWPSGRAASDDLPPTAYRQEREKELLVAPPNISHSFSHPFSGFTFLITYFIINVSSFLLFAAYIDGTSELKSRSALSRSSPSPSLTRLVPTPLSMKNAFRA